MTEDQQGEDREKDPESLFQKIIGETYLNLGHYQGPRDSKFSHKTQPKQGLTGTHDNQTSKTKQE